jgi:hypothetical protein
MVRVAGAYVARAGKTQPQKRTTTTTKTNKTTATCFTLRAACRRKTWTAGLCPAAAL